MDYQKSSRDALDELEISVRTFVQEQLFECFGPNWWKTRVSGKIKKDCESRANKEKSQRFPRLPQSELVHYTNLGELKDIICRADNFRDVFKSFFENTEQISSKLSELVGFRNPAAHIRLVLGREQYENIIVTGRSVLDAMEVERPPSFQTTFHSPAGDSEELEGVEVSPEEDIRQPNCQDNLPRPDYSTFFGRERELASILQHLNHPRAWITVVDGIGGVGKTALALRIAEVIRDQARQGNSDFEYIIWASAKIEKLSPTGIAQVLPTFTDLPSLLLTILEVVGFADVESTDPLALVNEILEIGKTLLVLDNLETVHDQRLFKFLEELPAPSKVLVTTRSRFEGSHRNLRLTALPLDDALNMIRQLAEELDSPELTNASDDQLRSLVDRVGGIPLAIRLAVGRIATGLPLLAYLDRLDSGAAQNDLLQFCFAESWANLDNDSKATLLGTHLFHYPPSEVELREVTGIPEMRLRDAIGGVLKRAFLNANYDEEGDTYRYELLPLTADFIKQESELHQELISRLQGRYSNYLVERGRYEEALGQISHLVPSSQTIPEAERLSNLLVDSAFRAYQGGDYGEAVKRLENAASYKDTAFLNHTWAVIERDEGAFSVARGKFRHSVELDKNRLPTWRSWGRMEQRLKNWQWGVHCFEQASQLPGSDPQDFHGLGVCISRLAGDSPSKERQDRLQEAEGALLRGFYKNPMGYRETHHNVVNHHALALILEKLGRPREALIQCQTGLRLEPNNERLLDLKLSLVKKR